jgi:tRNA(Ile)-lysidine synthase TilS/MesJ
MIYWDIYQVNSATENLIGVKFRGTMRKFAIENDIVLLAENAQDEENTVRFALIENTYEEELLEKITAFIRTIVPNGVIKQVLNNVPNPILSKLKNNDISRY